MRFCGIGLLILCLSVGCSAEPEIPPGLLDNVASADAGGAHDASVVPNFTIGSSSAYARGPYGNADGDVIQNFCFNFVWQDPKTADYDTRGMHRVCMSDFYDPDGSKGVRVLLLSTVAEWCTQCRGEWGGEAEFAPFAVEIKNRQAMGLRNLGLIYQDSHAEPATTTNAVNWARTYQIDVPFGLDSDFAMGAFAMANLQPFNMLVRTDTMQIVARYQGSQPRVLFGRIDQLLSEPLPPAGVSHDAGDNDAGTDADAGRDR